MSVPITRDIWMYILTEVLDHTVYTERQVAFDIQRCFIGRLSESQQMLLYKRFYTIACVFEPYESVQLHPLRSITDYWDGFAPIYFKVLTDTYCDIHNPSSMVSQYVLEYLIKAGTGWYDVKRAMNHMPLDHQFECIKRFDNPELLWVIDDPDERLHLDLIRYRPEWITYMFDASEAVQRLYCQVAGPRPNLLHIPYPSRTVVRDMIRQTPVETVSWYKRPLYYLFCLYCPSALMAAWILFDAQSPQNAAGRYLPLPLLFPVPKWW